VTWEWPPISIEKRINDVWKRICHVRKVPHRISKSYITTNSSVPSFYHLIKTHKSLVDLKIRPIVSNKYGPTTRLSWLLSKILRPFLDEVPAHLESSFSLMEKLCNLDVSLYECHPYPFSLDVVALYTSIPVMDAINNTIDFLRQRDFQYGLLQTEDICDLLQITLQNTYFTFYGKIYRQTKGLAMGSNVSPILAILFMDTLERNSLSSSTLVGFYKRYVDDIFCLTRDRDSANSFHKKEYFYIISQHFHQCTRKTSFIMKGNEDYLDVLQLRTKLTISTSLMLSFDKMDILIILSTKHIPFHIEETMIEIQNGFI
jgi:hypothetical protein